LYVTCQKQGIKSTAGLKTFMEEWNGHNAFAHPLMFDELLHQSFFLRYCNKTN